MTFRTDPREGEWPELRTHHKTRVITQNGVRRRVLTKQTWTIEMEQWLMEVCLCNVVRG